MNKRWVITGANGYLGGELCARLFQRGENVVGVMRRGRSHNAIDDLGIVCICYDELSSILSADDIFVHCAGKVGDRGTWDEYARTNIDWTVQLFELAAAQGVRCFIYVSSVAALGYRPRPSQAALDESSLPDLVDGELYGWSKLRAEVELLNRSCASTTRLSILRAGLIYGRAPSQVAQTWLRRGLLVDPGQCVPLVHITSFVDAVVRVAEHPQAHGVFLVVDEEQPTIHDLNTLKIHLGIMKYHPWRIGRAGFWLYCMGQTFLRIVRGRRGAVQKGYALARYYFLTRRLRYRTEKLRRLVGWSPTMALLDGLKTGRLAAPSSGPEV